MRGLAGDIAIAAIWEGPVKYQNDAASAMAVFIVQENAVEPSRASCPYLAPPRPTELKPWSDVLRLPVPLLSRPG